MNLSVSKNNSLHIPFNKRFGPEFFKRISEQAGVFWMLDNKRNLLLLDSCNNLRQKLWIYKHLVPIYCANNGSALINEIHDIQWTTCPDFIAAQNLQKELLTKFNPVYANININNKNFLFMQIKKEATQLIVRTTKKPQSGFATYGAFKGRVLTQQAYSALLRMLYFGTHQISAIDWPHPLNRSSVPAEFALT